VTDTIEERLCGDPLRIIKFYGWISIAMFFLSCLCLWWYYKWAKWTLKDYLSHQSDKITKDNAGAFLEGAPMSNDAAVSAFASEAGASTAVDTALL
jgi:hypothetical protein